MGRLSPEKGVGTFLSAWEGLDAPLRVAGDGPLLAAAQRKGNGKIEFLGRLSTTKVSVEMSRASFLVMPSECYEGFPMVLAEAFAIVCPWSPRVWAAWLRSSMTA